MFDMTPREFEILENVYREKQKQEEENRIILAYMTALWTAQWFSKKHPKSLDEILGKKEKQKEMTAKQIFNNIKMINTAMGGEVIERS